MTRGEMVELLRSRGVVDPRVLEAFASVPREAFVASVDPYADMPLPIGLGQTISQPYAVALTVVALDLRATDIVLEVGTGSGYAAAVLSKLCARVVTIERHEVLAQAAKRVLAGYPNVEVVVGDGTLGWEAGAPYDAIAVAANAPAPPPSLLRQLAPGGRMVLPFGRDHDQRLVKITRTADRFDQLDLGAVRYVPLLGREGW